MQQAVDQAEQDAAPEAGHGQAQNSPALVGCLGNNLGRTYTPRLDFDWVAIPASYFWMGSDKAQDKHTNDQELPQHKLYLPVYRITRVPVTVAQFEQFIKATGYKTSAERQDSVNNWAEKDGNG